MNSLTPEQLVLDIGLVDEPSFDNFVAGQNRLLMLQLQAWAAGHDERFIYLWGPTGAGVSHLLQACYQQLLAQDQSAVYLSCSDPEIGAEQLAGLEWFDFLCLDHLEAVVGLPDWEQALFHLFNALHSSGSFLLVGANFHPHSDQVQLPDLRSRLGWGLPLTLTPLTDQQKIQALVARAQTLGLGLNYEQGQYILHRSGRSLGELMVVLHQLDQASMSAKKRLSIPFIKQIMAW